MSYLDHKDGEVCLTTIEREIQREQEASMRTCLTCHNADVHQRSGFRGCMEPKAPDTKRVMSHEIHCEYYV